MSHSLTSETSSDFESLNITERITELNRISNKPSKNYVHRSNALIYRSVWQRIEALRTKCDNGKYLTRLEISRYRLPRFQMLLTEMLMQGYHRAFTILFNIHRDREKKRQDEGPDSSRWLQLPISEWSTEELTRIRDLLIQMEMGERAGDTLQMHQATVDLGVLLSGGRPEDGWITEQLTRKQLSFVDKNRSGDLDGGYMHAMALLHAGIAAHKNDELEKAADYLTQVYSLAYSNNWVDANGQNMLIESSRYLCEIYLDLVCRSGAEVGQILYYLKHAHEISKEANLKEIEAKCCHYLGQVFENLSNNDMAMAYFRGLYEVAKSINNQSQLGQACEAIARCYEKLGNMPEALRYVEKFVTIAERSCDWVEYARACRILGQTYGRYGDYHKAYLSSKESYFITYCLQNSRDIEESKILTGISIGQSAAVYSSQRLINDTRHSMEVLSQFRATLTNIERPGFISNITLPPGYDPTPPSDSDYPQQTPSPASNSTTPEESPAQITFSQRMHQGQHNTVEIIPSKRAEYPST